jgi:hypothetical protein
LPNCSFFLAADLSKSEVLVLSKKAGRNSLPIGYVHNRKPWKKFGFKIIYGYNYQHGI